MDAHLAGGLNPQACGVLLVCALWHCAGHMRPSSIRDQGHKVPRRTSRRAAAGMLQGDDVNVRNAEAGEVPYRCLEECEGPSADENPLGTSLSGGVTQARDIPCISLKLWLEDHSLIQCRAQQQGEHSEHGQSTLPSTSALHSHPSTALQGAGCQGELRVSPSVGQDEWSRRQR